MMRKFVILTLVCAVLATLVASPVSAAKAAKVDDIKFPKLNQIEMPEVEKVTLENGLRLYLLEDKSLPLFRANARINTGSYLDPADKAGLAQMCGDLIRTGGTRKWTGDELDSLLEGIGGSVESGMDMVSGAASVNVLSEFSDLGLEALAEILRYPVFEEDKIDLVRVGMRTNISRRNEDLHELTRREWLKQVYGPDSPFSRHTEYKTVDAITRDDLIAFHDLCYHPENVQISIWGDFDKEAVIATVKKYFANWEKGSMAVPPVPEEDYNLETKVFYAPKLDAKQSYVRMGHIGGKVSDPDYADRIVMNSILGGGFGSRVTDNVRTKLGLAYSTGGRVISNIAYPGYFFIYASTAPGNTVQAAKEMLTQINSMHSDLASDKEMAKGKDGYLNSFVFNFDSRGEVVNRMMTYDFYNMPEDFLQQEKERVEKVSPEAVMAAATANIHPDAMYVVVTGNAEEFDEPLEALGLGAVDTIDITIPSGEVKKELAITPENIEKGTNLLGKALEAAGGLDNFKNIKSIEKIGALTLSMNGQDMSAAFEEIWAGPETSRNVTKIMGMEIKEIRNGNQGWKTDMASMQMIPMTEDDIVDADKSNARDLIQVFQRFDDPYYRAVYDDTGHVGDAAVEWIALVDDQDEVIIRFGISPGDSRIMGATYWGASPMGEGNLLKIYGEFAESDGVTLANQAITEMDGQKVVQIDITRRTINGEVPPGSFDAP